MEDPRSVKRSLGERKQPNLIWRQGKFSEEEIRLIRDAVVEWQHEKGLSWEETVDQLRWAKDSGIKAWGDIAHKSTLIFRKIESIRSCTLRHCLGPKKAWSAQEAAEMVKLQNLLGENKWKAIAQELGRTIEEVQNKGKSLKRTPEKPDFLDADIVAAIQETSDSSIPIHGVSWSQVSLTLTGSSSFSEIFRDRWRKNIFRKVVKNLLPIKHIIDKVLLWKVRLATRGDLEDKIPSEDFDALPWAQICPFFPSAVAQRRVQKLLEGVPGQKSFRKTVKRACENFEFENIEEDSEDIFSAVQTILADLADTSARSFNRPQIDS